MPESAVEDKKQQEQGDADTEALKRKVQQQVRYGGGSSTQINSSILFLLLKGWYMPPKVFKERERELTCFIQPTSLIKCVLIKL